MLKLFQNDDSDTEELGINKDYAAKYEAWRQKEELNKLKTKYGDNFEESSETSEDDEGEEIPEDFEKTFFKTLSCLKNKDPSIYNEKVNFFEEVNKKFTENELHMKKKKEKTLTLRSYEQQIILQTKGEFSDTDNEDDEVKRKIMTKTSVQEERELKESFKKIIEGDDDQEKILLKPKIKTKEQVEKEEADYREWLKGQKQDIDEEKLKDLKPLKEYWNNPNLDKNEKFLRDYVLNKKFLDKETTDVDIDDEHVIHDSDENLSEDEKNIDKQEEFEHKYNFRFEEPDEEFIKRYPRTLEDTLRKKDTRRAEKRAEVKARKEKEKVRKQEELKQLKALKRKEIVDKIEKLKEITGNDDLQFNTNDIEGDFDPDEYDKKMNQIFNEDYYAGEEGDLKPEFPEIDKELCVESTWDNYDPNTEEIDQQEDLYYDGPHCEDSEFNMDADYDAQKDFQTELVESTKKRKRRRQSKFAEMISKDKPKFDPTEHTSYKEYYDQYYALDYEDMIGNLPCRFKYRQVVPNDYGLSVEEVLMADDRELNKWYSLKKALQYTKSEQQEKNEIKIYKQKAANEALKRKILRSLYRDPKEEEETEAPSTNNLQNTEEQKSTKKRKRKKKVQIDVGDQVEVVVSDDREVRLNDTKSTENNHTLKETYLEKDAQKKISEDSNKYLENDVLNPDIKTNKKKRKLKSIVDKDNGDNKIKEEKECQKKKCKESKDVSRNKESTSIMLAEESTSNVIQKKSSRSVINQETSNKNKNQTDPLRKTKNKGISKKDKSKLKNNLKNKNENGNELSKKEARKLFYKNLKQKKEKSKETDQLTYLSTERLKAYGFNPKKFKNKLKYKKND